LGTTTTTSELENDELRVGRCVLEWGAEGRERERERGLSSGLNRQAGEAVEAEAGARLMAVVKARFEGALDGRRRRR
jgi:hypothetical protein